MLDLLILHPGLVTPVTIHKVLVVGTVVVAIAVVFRRFGLATMTTVPLIALAGVDEFHPSAAGRAARHVRNGSRNMHHAITVWFIAGICLAGLTLAFVLVVSFLTMNHAQRSDLPPCYPEPAEGGPTGRPTDPVRPGFGRGRNRRKRGRAVNAPPRDWRDVEWLPHLRRLSLLTREFLLSVHEGWPVAIDLRSREARWFLDALLNATFLVIDNRDGLPAAITEAERRWVVICSQPGAGGSSDEGNIPDFDPDDS